VNNLESEVGVQQKMIDEDNRLRVYALISELRLAAEVWGEDDGGPLYERAATELQRVQDELASMQSLAKPLDLPADTRMRWGLRA
jgi:hypothetical protein